MLEIHEDLEGKISLFDQGHVKVYRNSKWWDNLFEGKENFSSLRLRSLCAGLLETKVKSEHFGKNNSYTSPEIRDKILLFNKRIYNKYHSLVSFNQGNKLRGATKVKKLIYEELLYYINIINENLKVFELVERDKREYEFLRDVLVKKYEKEIRLITKKTPSREDRSLLSIALFLSSLPNYNQIVVYSPDSDIYDMKDLISNCPNLKRYDPSKIEVVNTNDQPIHFKQFFKIEFNSDNLSMSKVRKYLFKNNYYPLNN